MKTAKKPVKTKHYVTQDVKTKFRRTKAWKDLREKKKKEQKNDPITLKPLSKTYNLHHLNCDATQYTNISNEEHFIGLNSNSHDLVHFLWGNERCRKDWRQMIERLIQVLELMDKYYTGRNQNLNDSEE